eukprot:11221957-Lingulodinium_polyedra.AAC.1
MPTAGLAGQLQSQKKQDGGRARAPPPWAHRLRTRVGALATKNPPKKHAKRARSEDQLIDMYLATRRV